MRTLKGGRSLSQRTSNSFCQKAVLTLVYLSDKWGQACGGTPGCHGDATVTWHNQADVSNRRSIMSATCSTRYLMYFSGFLVKGTLAYLCRKAP